VRRAIEVTWNEAGRAGGLPTRLFAKTTPSLATRLSAGMAAPSEGRFLRELRPELAIEAPVCLHTARDAFSGRSVHLFEDLTATRGARFCDVSTRIDRTGAERIVDTLARLHGHFARAGGPEATWLATYEDFFRAAQNSGIQRAHEQALTRAASVLPAPLAARRDELWPAAERAAAAHAQAPRTVIHSDPHLGNWFVTADGAFGLADWARVCRGLWARDVAYALTTTLETEPRRAWETQLLRRYLARLRDEFGVAISEEAAERAYRQQIFLALLMWTPTLCPPPTLPEMQPEATSLEMIRRIAAAIDDLDALGTFSADEGVRS
jgi:thiamine kinase-like enzyme